LLHPLPGAEAKRRAFLAERPGGLRVAVFGSFWRGVRMTDYLRSMERNGAGTVEIVGVATDEVMDGNARISKAKRFWQYLSPAEAAQQLLQILSVNLREGIPAYTGTVKCAGFAQGVLPRWNPQVIFMGTFGQLVDKAVFGYPEFGMYNFHSADLAVGKYPGADPFTAMIAKGETTMRVTMHKVDEGTDSGQIVWRSCDIATGYEVLSQLPVDRDRLWPHWISALHFVTGFAAAEMACTAVNVINEAKRPLEPTDSQGVSMTPAHFDTEVVAATIGSAMKSSLLTLTQVRELQSAPGVAIALKRMASPALAL
jgi:folate-dependent phosphoribosylglycinamide formyltransferase PurN